MLLDEMLFAFIAIDAQLLLTKSLYIGLLLLLVAASFGLPLPEDIPLLLAGCLCRLGYGQVFYAVLVGLAGVLIGDFTLYIVGRRFGMGVLELRPFNLLITRSHIAQMKRFYRKRGNLVIFFGRFFAGVRSVMCVTAGLCRVPAWKFILIDVSGALITVPSLIGLGWWFSDKIAKVAKGVLAFDHVLGGLAAAGIIAWLVYIHLTKTRTKAVKRQLDKAEQSEGAETDNDERERIGV